jgi:hypothetical protein
VRVKRYLFQHGYAASYCGLRVSLAITAFQLQRFWLGELMYASLNGVAWFLRFCRADIDLKSFKWFIVDRGVELAYSTCFDCLNNTAYAMGKLVRKRFRWSCFKIRFKLLKNEKQKFVSAFMSITLESWIPIDECPYELNRIYEIPILSSSIVKMLKRTLCLEEHIPIVISLYYRICALTIVFGVSVVHK